MFILRARTEIIFVDIMIINKNINYRSGNVTIRKNKRVATYNIADN